MSNKTPENFIKTKKLAGCAVLTSLALIFSYIEYLLPLSLAIPGIKLGLANIVSLIALYSLGPGYAFFIGIARVFLSSLLFGSAFSMIYSLAGCILSIFTMWLFKRIDKFSISGVSMAGGVMHNIGQILIAALVMESSAVFYYLPVLILAGMVTGIGIGIISTLVINKLK